MGHEETNQEITIHRRSQKLRLWADNVAMDLKGFGSAFDSKVGILS